MNVPFSKVTIGQEEIDAVTRVLSSGWLAAGKETEAFEKEFAEYVGVKYAIFTNSCTSALKMAYKWAKEEMKYKSMICTKNTFCATYSAAKEIGLDVFSGDKEDIEWKEVKSWNDLYEQFRVNVHYGSIKNETPCLIEDSAHRIEPNDTLVGKIRCYSFYATKNMTTGSGGMLVTNDKDIYERCRTYWRDGLTSSTHDRQTGKSWNYEVKTMAGGYDGNDIAAAIGRVQLKKLPEFNKRRNQICQRYNESLNQNWQGNHLYPYFVKSSEQVERFIEFLKSKGIASGYHYPNTGWLGVSLPIYPLLTDEEVDYIIQSVKEYENTKL